MKYDQISYLYCHKYKILNLIELSIANITEEYFKTK